MKKIILLSLISMLLMAACQPAAQAPTPTQPPAETAVDQPTSQPTSMDETEPPVETAQEPTEESTQPLTDFNATFRLEQIATGLASPVDLDAPDDGSGRLFVVDQMGLIRVIDSEDNLLDTPFLDLQDRLVSLGANYDERGLLGLAFHPNYDQNGRFFVYYSAPLRDEAPAGWNHTSMVSEFTVSSTAPNTADPESEKVIMEIDQPQGNHNSGAIVFGPDGYLYIPLGDGGGANDTNAGHVSDWYDVNQGGNGQDIEDNQHGSILRIDIDQGDPYAIPEDNPNISENFPETWAYGFRNPYRIAFDPEGDNELFVGDAGQNLWEEVSIVEAGGNYGWNVREGTHCFSAAEPSNPDAITDCPTEDPDGNPLIDPVIEFRNSNHPEGGLGTSVIGGVVYRGSTLPNWNGHYLFGQWSTSFQVPDGDIFVSGRTEQGLWEFKTVQILGRENDELGEYLLGFGQDTDGEVYVLTSLNTGPSGTDGSVYRVIHR